DLDRCDPDLVANVLDAVHLLLALRLFVVIVGVDPRWLDRSLRDRHPVLLKSPSSDISWTSPADYLEKIFQLTYTLPHMSPSSCADLLVAAARDTQTLSTPQYQVREGNDDHDIDISPQDISSEPDASSEPGEDFPTSHIEDTAKYLAEALTL